MSKGDVTQGQFVPGRAIVSAGREKFGLEKPRDFPDYAPRTRRGMHRLSSTKHQASEEGLVSVLVSIPFFLPRRAIDGVDVRARCVGREEPIRVTSFEARERCLTRNASPQEVFSTSQAVLQVPGHTKQKIRESGFFCFSACRGGNARVSTRKNRSLCGDSLAANAPANATEYVQRRAPRLLTFAHVAVSPRLAPLA